MFFKCLNGHFKNETKQAAFIQRMKLNEIKIENYLFNFLVKMFYIAEKLRFVSL